MRSSSEETRSLASRYLLVGGDDLGQSMSRYLADRIMDPENVKLLTNTEVRELMGDDRLDGVVLEDNSSGARRTLGVRAFFVFIGAEANASWLQGVVELDKSGFILTGELRSLYAREGRLRGTFSGTVPPGDEPAGRIRGE